MLEKSITLLFAAGVLLLSVLAAQSRPHIVVDAETGIVLSHRDAHRRWAPASLTKLMTTYVAFKAIQLQQITMSSPVTISAKARRQPPSKMGFPVGTVLTIDQAIKIIMVKSANDVALAIGESVGGSEEEFVALMNAHARRLGMENTQFRNPHGLPDPEQYTTALDMAKLAIALQKDFPEYKEYFNVAGLIHGRRRLQNFNRLLTRFPGTTGMKTGYVCASGYNVVVSAERKIASGAKRKLISVVLGGSSGRRRNLRAAELLYAAFQKDEDFGLYTVQNLHPFLEPSKTPADISELMCTRKKRKVRVARQGSIKELETRYMVEPFDAGPYQRIVLGGATGPNPHASRFIPSLVVEGVAPVPTKRPDLICPVIAADQVFDNELPVLKTSTGKASKPEHIDTNASVDETENSVSAEQFKDGEHPVPAGCLPVPLAKPADYMPHSEIPVLVAAAKPVKSPEQSATVPAEKKKVSVAGAGAQPRMLRGFVAEEPAENAGQERIENRLLEFGKSGGASEVVEAAPQVATKPEAEQSAPVEIAIAKVIVPTKNPLLASVIALQEDAPVIAAAAADGSDFESEAATYQLASLDFVEPAPTIVTKGEALEDRREWQVASLENGELVIPTKRPPNIRKPSEESQEKKSASSEEKTKSKADLKSTKKVRNPFAANFCKMYRQSGCIPELAQAQSTAKKGSKKAAAKVKRSPAHCAALQTLYESNRKNGLDCNSS